MNDNDRDTSYDWMDDAGLAPMNRPFEELSEEEQYAIAMDHYGMTEEIDPDLTLIKI